MKYLKVIDLINKFAQQTEKSGESIVDLFKKVKIKASLFDCTIFVSAVNGRVKLDIDSPALRGFQKNDMMDTEEAKALVAEIKKYQTYLNSNITPQLQRILNKVLLSEKIDPSKFQMNQFELISFSS